MMKILLVIFALFLGITLYVYIDVAVINPWNVEVLEQQVFKNSARTFGVQGKVKNVSNQPLKDFEIKIRLMARSGTPPSLETVQVVSCAVKNDVLEKDAVTAFTCLFDVVPEMKNYWLRFSSAGSPVLVVNDGIPTLTINKN
jgi:hypothetical protein